jgi:hypothetical protein
MIPKNIIEELFDIRYRPSDVTVDTILEEIIDMGYSIDRCNDCDLIIYIDISNDQIEGEVRIDRVKRIFQLNIKSKNNSFVVLPSSGDWNCISNHLELLNVRNVKTD